MKKTYIYAIALFFLSLSVTAQIDRSIQPAPGPAPKINLGKPETFELKNGLKVMVVENHKLPRASATLTIDNGPIFEGEKAGVTSLLSSLLGTGTPSISKDDFNEEVDYLGANIYFGSQSASASSLSKYFPRILELMADAAINPTFSQEEYDKNLAILLDGLKSDEKNVSSIANRMQYALAYGKNHPYGEFTTEETVNNVSLADVETFYNTYFKPNNAYLIIVGDVNFNEIKKLVTKLFSKWEAGTLPAYEIPAVANAATTEIDFINMPNAVQSNIYVVSTTDLKMSNPDYYALKLANAILGGGGGKRLFQNLREDKGYTYGSYSSIGDDERTAALFSANAEVRNMVTDSSVVEILSEITRIRDTKVTEEELETAKAEYVGSFVRNVEKPSVVANLALNIETKNLPEDFYETYLAKINAVTIEDIQRVSQKYFTVDQARIVIVGKALDVLPNLEKLTYPINYFDKEGNPTSKPELTKPIPADVTKKTVIDNYFNAIGGVEKINAINSTLATYEAEAMGSVITSTEKRTATKYANETSMAGNVVAKIVMTKDGVFMNKQPLPPAMASEMTYTLGTFSEIGLLNNEGTVLTGIETVDGEDFYVISTKGEIVSTSVYFNVKTGFKAKEVQVISMGGQTQNQESSFADYQDYNGVKFPATKTGNLGPQVVTFKLTDAKVNEGVSESDFE
jgi:predicted Zn-dependent peptidase